MELMVNGDGCKFDCREGGVRRLDNDYCYRNFFFYCILSYLSVKCTYTQKLCVYF